MRIGPTSFHRRFSAVCIYVIVFVSCMDLYSVLQLC